jgi:hypothetical protein
MEVMKFLILILCLILSGCNTITFRNHQTGSISIKSDSVGYSDGSVYVHTSDGKVEKGTHIIRDGNYIYLYDGKKLLTIYRLYKNR